MVRELEKTFSLAGGLRNRNRVCVCREVAEVSVNEDDCD